MISDALDRNQGNGDLWETPSAAFRVFPWGSGGSRGFREVPYVQDVGRKPIGTPQRAFPTDGIPSVSPFPAVELDLKAPFTASLLQAKNKRFARDIASSQAYS